MIETIGATIIGGLISLAVAHLYYKRAGEELRNEAAALRKFATMMLTAMEGQGWVKLNRDSDGNVSGFIFEHVASGGGIGSGSADVKFVPAHPIDTPHNEV